MWHVYILRCADNSLYTGTAKDLAARLAVHNAGKGAKYTRGRLPVYLLYHEVFSSRSEALSREIAIKSLSRAQKEDLLSTHGAGFSIDRSK